MANVGFGVKELVASTPIVVRTEAELKNTRAEEPLVQLH